MLSGSASPGLLTPRHEQLVADVILWTVMVLTLARQAIRLCHEPPLKVVVDIPRMVDAVQKMLQDALDAFVRHDIAMAETVVAADDQIDEWLAEVFRMITSELERDTALVRSGLTTLLFAKYIERLADHIVNIAQMVVFLVRGDDIRHTRMK